MKVQLQVVHFKNLRVGWFCQGHETESIGLMINITSKEDDWDTSFVVRITEKKLKELRESGKPWDIDFTPDGKELPFRLNLGRGELNIRPVEES